MNKSMIENFEMFFPSLASMMVKYWSSSPYELIIELDDGVRFIFDDNDKSIRRLPKDSNNLSEQEFKNEFGTRLRRIMWYKGITQEDLSRATGITQTMISKYVTGHACPSFSNVDKICKVLGCSMDRLRYLNDPLD